MCTGLQKRSGSMLKHGEWCIGCHEQSAALQHASKTYTCLLMS